MTDGVIVYEDAIITFIDILGFRDIVRNSTAEETSGVLDAVEYSAKPIQITPDADNTRNNPIVHIFSDTIIRIRPVEREDNRICRIGLLFHELLDIVHIQCELINHKVILRGVVSYGQVSASEARIFGPGLIRAYELERNCAIYPRIIIDPTLLIEFERNKLLRSDHNSFQDETRYVYDLLRAGNDMLWFIDYLRVVESEIEPATYLQFLLDHKNLIIDRARNQKLPHNVILKFMWLADYQNQLVTSFSNDWFVNCDIERDDLLIKRSDIGQ